MKLKIHLSDILGAVSITGLYTGCAVIDCGEPIIPVTALIIAAAAGVGWYVESGERAKDRRDAKRRTADSMGTGLERGKHGRT